MRNEQKCMLRDARLLSICNWNGGCWLKYISRGGPELPLSYRNAWQSFVFAFTWIWSIFLLHSDWQRCMRVAFIVRMAPKTSSPDFFVCVDYDGIITHKSMYVFAEISLCHACRVPECQTCGYLAFVQNLRVRTALVSSPGDTGDRRGVFLVFFSVVYAVILCFSLHFYLLPDGL